MSDERPAGGSEDVPQGGGFGMPVPRWIRWAGILAVLAALVLIATSFQQSFAFSAPWSSTLPFDEDPGFLWDFRGIDVLVQGVIVMAATVAVTSLLREYSVVGEDE
ncbi:MAG: hypothetical protein WHS82_03365 [Candidatus Methanosuratincola sp.]